MLYSVRKYRRKLLLNGVDTHFKELLQHINEKEHIVLLKLEVMPDHIHLPVPYERTCEKSEYAIAATVGKLKIPCL